MPIAGYSRLNLFQELGTLTEAQADEDLRILYKRFIPKWNSFEAANGDYAAGQKVFDDNGVQRELRPTGNPEVNPTGDTVQTHWIIKQTGGTDANQVQNIINSNRNTVVVNRPDSVRMGATPDAGDLIYGAPTPGDSVVYFYLNGSIDSYNYGTNSWDAPRYVPPGVIEPRTTDPTGTPPSTGRLLAVFEGKLYSVVPPSTLYSEIAAGGALDTVHRLDPAGEGWPYIRSPRQQDFQASLDADQLGPNNFSAGDTLMVETPDDGHFFRVQIKRDQAVGSLSLLPMRRDIPIGKEFQLNPANRSTYYPGYRVEVDRQNVKMNPSGAWLPDEPLITGNITFRDRRDIWVVSTQAVRDAIQGKYTGLRVITTLTSVIEIYDSDTQTWSPYLDGFTNQDMYATENGDLTVTQAASYLNQNGVYGVRIEPGSV